LTDAQERVPVGAHPTGWNGKLLAFS